MADNTMMPNEAGDVAKVKEDFGVDLEAEVILLGK